VATPSGKYGNVFVYSTEDEIKHHATCGTDNTHSHFSVALRPKISFGVNVSVINASVDVVEVASVSDWKYIQAIDGTVHSTAIRNIQLYNIVKQVFEGGTFNVPLSLRLKAQYFFSSGDPYTIPINTDGTVSEDNLLDAFTTWSSANLGSSQFDVAHLLTSHKFDSTTVGIAYVGTACDPNYKTGLSLATFANINTVANVMAHEIGHNLGMEHDGTPGSGANCPASGFLMGAYVGSCSNICPISSCSIAAENNYAPSFTCLDAGTEMSCSDGLFNGAEEGVDCGGPNCPPCASSPTSKFPTNPSQVPTTKFPTNPSQVPTTKFPTPLPTSTKFPTPLPTSTKLPTPLPTSTKFPTPLPTSTKFPTPTPTTKFPTPTPTTKFPTPLPTSTPQSSSTKFPTLSITPTSFPTYSYYDLYWYWYWQRFG
jgi:hypothetical protein